MKKLKLKFRLPDKKLFVLRLRLAIGYAQLRYWETIAKLKHRGAAMVSR